MIPRRWLLVAAIVLGMVPMFPTCVPFPGPHAPVVDLPDTNPIVHVVTLSAEQAEA